MGILKFISSNILYIIWFVIYFTIAWVLLGANTQSLIIVSIVYGTSITIALCPIGEMLLRLIENCRNPATEQERSYLAPIFEEVYQNAKEVNPQLSNAIQLYIMDAMYVNAFAIGRTTVAVTNGAIETFTADELKGVLGHELGHMTYGHTKALLLSVIGNFFFSIIVWVLRFLLYIIEGASSVFASINVVGLVFKFMAFMARIIFELSIFLFVNLGEIILALNSRSNETQADEFAFNIGFGREQISALYILQKIAMNSKLKLSEKMKASHPHTAYRIAHLEKLENESLA